MLLLPLEVSFSSFLNMILYQFKVFFAWPSSYFNVIFRFIMNNPILLIFVIIFIVTIIISFVRRWLPGRG